MKKTFADICELLWQLNDAYVFGRSTVTQIKELEAMPEGEK